MESDYEAKVEIEGICDVENTVFVAVGQNVKESKSTLLWAFHSFPGKKLCLLHVHQPAHLVTLMDERFSANKLKQQVVKSCRLVERQKMQKLLNQYLLLLDQLGACKVWTVMDNVEKGIMQIIAQHNVRRLVMGTTAVEHQAEKLSELKSKKAAFVCQQAPVSCHIWFTCNGFLVYAKCGDSSSHVKCIAALSSSTSGSGSSTTVLKSHEDANEAQVQCIAALSSSTGSCGTPLLKSREDANKDPSELKKHITVLSSSTSSSGTTFLRSHEDAAEAHLQCITAISISTSSSRTTLLESCEDANKDFAEGISWGFAFQGLEHSTQSKEEVAGFESLCMEEIKRRQEMEEILARQWQEIEKMKDLYAKCTTELQMINDNIPELESQLMESHSIKEELEEKIIQAVNLLVTFKEKRDKLQIERDNAKRHNDELKNLVMANASDLSRLHFLEFTFWEINEATKNFDPSWKIGDGRSGSVYKGFLHHLKVAIKMLPSHGCQGHVEFENEAWFLSRVRHPNVVTLIGICPESRSLIYEYLENESLEDCLLCRGKTPPLSWQTRMKIASEICSALVFLHSNTPSLIHGSLKPTNILLDANFVSKLSDIAIYRLIPKDSQPTYSTPLCNESDIEASAYIDPELLEAGELSTESDVYSFGVVILRLLTGRPAVGVVKDVKCALERDNFSALLDLAAGKWSIEQARNVAQLALRCCEQKRENRPDLVSEVWSEIELMKESWSSSKLGPKGPHRTPSHFVCPIFQEVMKDPHIAADGFTYEGDAIKGWINSGHETSPMTNLKLDHCGLLPNYALYYAIQEWQQQS